MKTKLEYGSLGFLLAIFFSILISVSSCYATCKPPEVRAARHGVVLDCSVERPDTRHTICRVSTKTGDQDFRYVSCQ
jgi:hypothetical protein